MIFLYLTYYLHQLINLGEKIIIEEYRETHTENNVEFDLKSNNNDISIDSDININDLNMTMYRFWNIIKWNCWYF